MEKEKRRKRHCWECRRRCVVCDSKEPACNRCLLAGTECPGYNNIKPTKIKWLSPGEVLSRPRKRKKYFGKPKEHDMGTIVSRKAEAAYNILDAPSFPPLFEIKTDAHALAEGVQYFNSCIYHELLPIHELGQNRHIYQLSTKHIQTGLASPDYLKFGMLCMLLSHRINRMRGDFGSKALETKFYAYWGLAVKSLIDAVETVEGRADDMVLVGVMTLLLADVQQGTLLDWRYHLEGIYKIIEIRGGFEVVARSRNLEPMLLSFWFASVMGNTTCPASQLSMTDTHLKTLDFLQEKYNSTVFCFQMCPLPLFLEIIKTNHLRALAAAPSLKNHENLTQQTHKILHRVSNFSPSEWAYSKPASREFWTLLGKAYQAATSIYTILSLQSLSILPLNTTLRAHCTQYTRILYYTLQTGLPSPTINRFLVWPLILLGVEAIHGTAETKDFVREWLPRLSREVGTCVPLTAKAVLERWWTGGGGCWDACWERAYIFTMQFAVDTSGLG